MKILIAVILLSAALVIVFRIAGFLVDAMVVAIILAALLYRYRKLLK